VRAFTPAERRARLARRHFLSRPATSVSDITADFVGLHATDPATPYLSLWARLPGFTVSDLDEQLYQ
jgi:DNA glycosylase AlkZ-like